VSGDQIFVYTQTYENPYFIFAVSNTWSSVESSTTSLLPAQLEGTNAYTTLGYEDNALYNASNMGFQEELLELIANQSNWLTSSSQRYELDGIGFFSVIEPLSSDDGNDSFFLSDNGVILISGIALGVVVAMLCLVVYCYKENQRKSAERLDDDERDGNNDVEIANALHQ
jgi:hypothetical protein